MHRSGMANGGSASRHNSRRRPSRHLLETQVPDYPDRRHALSTVRGARGADEGRALVGGGLAPLQCCSKPS